MNRVNFTGEQIGPYLVRERIGQGGMADVYRAYQPSVKREVALKIILLFAGTEHDEFRKRFAQEAEMVAALEHPHILPIFDYGVSENLAFLAMRLLRGGTVRDLLLQGRIPLERTADLFGQCSRALGYAHRCGVIHRDLKPSNMLLDNEGNAYLTDFGLAKVIGGSSQLTTTGSIIGTPAYMSPEQLRGDPVDHRADIYSMGVVLYHMVVGRPPFEALTTFSLIYQHVEKEPPPPREIYPEVPEPVQFVILRALQKSPAARFDSIEQMSDALDVALGRKSSLAERSSVSLPPAPASLHPRLAGDVAPTPTPSTLPTRGATSPTSVTIGPATITATITRPRLWLGAAAAIVLLVLLAAFLLSRSTAPTFQPPTVLLGERGSTEDVVPSPQEVDVARQRLGSDGFIAYIVCNQSSEFFAVTMRQMRELADRYNLPFRVYDSQTDANQQIIQIERARADGARALIVCVLDPQLLVDTLTSVQEAGIPLALTNANAPPTYGGVLITNDDYLLGFAPGQVAGQIVAEEMDGEADVVILDFPSLPPIVERANGLEAGLRESAPDANVIGRFQGGIAEFAYDSISGLLEEDVHFDVILSINDAGSYGAIQALEEHGIDPESVMIFSVDAEAQARQFIREGHYMRASVQVGAEALSFASIDAIVKLLAGSTLPEMILGAPGDVITRGSLDDGS